MKRYILSFPYMALLLYLLVVLSFPIRADLGPLYLYWILLAGPVIFVPWGLKLISSDRPVIQMLANNVLPFGGVFLAVSYCLPTGYIAAGFAVIWFLIVLYLLVWAWGERSNLSQPTLLAIVFLNVAAAWALANRLGWQPLDFQPLIVLLTAIHFHYAGFALAILTALLPKNRRTQNLILGLLVGVGGVAIGITSTQLNGPPLIEIISVTWMVFIGWAIAAAQIKNALLNKGAARVLLILGSLSLIAGLFLALFYGWRFYHQLDWLTMPWMYATHGVLNSVGFVLLSFIGWTIQSSK